LQTHVERLLAIAGLQNAVAEEAEHVRGDRAHGSFVIDDEDRRLNPDRRRNGGTCGT
jgi:hypothetical protein